jgi:hypothetical protein
MGQVALLSEQQDPLPESVLMKYLPATNKATAMMPMTMAI